MTDIPFVDLTVHHKPRDMRDRVTLGFTKLLRWCSVLWVAVTNYFDRGMTRERSAEPGEACAAPGSP